MVKINVLSRSLCMLHVLYIILMNTINKKKFMFIFYIKLIRSNIAEQFIFGL